MKNQTKNQLMTALVLIVAAVLTTAYFATAQTTVSPGTVVAVGCQPTTGATPGATTWLAPGSSVTLDCAATPTPAPYVTPEVTQSGPPTIVAGVGKLLGIKIPAGTKSFDVVDCGLTASAKTNGLSQIPTGWQMMPVRKSADGNFVYAAQHVFHVGEKTTVNFGLSLSGTSEALCVAHTSVNGDILAGTPASQANAASTTFTGPSLTPGTPNTMGMLFCSGDKAGTITNKSFGEINAQKMLNGRVIAEVEGLVADSTATGTVTMTTDTSSASVCYHIALRSHSYATPTPTPTPSPTPT